MTTSKTQRVTTIFVTLVMMFSLFSSTVSAAPWQAPAAPVTFTILHTNDFHGQLEAASADPNQISTPAMARTARVINAIRAAKGSANVLLVDAGDEMQGSLLSNLGDGTATGKGKPTIGTFNQMNYDVATFGNHEFDWGQVNLANRTSEALYPYVTANIVKMTGADCASTNTWEKPDFADAPYVIKTIGTAPNQVKVAFIGVTTLETPTITIASATNGLCFKDPTLAIKNYYNQMKVTDGADVIVVLSHLGFNDGGYGYGIPVYGDQTLATKLITDGYPVNLIIGGHSHTSVAAPGTSITVNGKTTLVAQSAYNGRRIGQAEVTVSPAGAVSIVWKVTVWTQKSGTNPANSEWRTYTTQTAFTSDTDVSEDAGVAAVIASYKTPEYNTLVNTPVGYSQVDLSRRRDTVMNPGAATLSYATMTDNMMGAFIDDAIYDYLNTDPYPTNDIDLFFNNAGGIRTDWCWNGSDWVASGCTNSGLLPTAGLLTYGDMFTVLPFGNATIVGDMTGAQILEVLNFAPNAASGLIQPAGLKFKYYRYADTLAPGTVSSPYPYAWGAFDVTVLNKNTGIYEPLNLKKNHRVGTNEFLAPAGGDSYNAFKYMTNITYWGDMLNAVNAYVNANYTLASPYKGPNGDGTLDDRIVPDGDGDFVFDGGTEIVPVTILHHNDSHGNLDKTTFVGYTQLAKYITQERLHNPTRTLLLSSGDNIQGDAMSYYFKTAPTGFATDGTPIADPTMHIQPLIKMFNAMNYDAMTLGNHEFNFGKDIFTSVLSQATFPILQANVSDDGSYGLAAANVKPYIEKTIGGDINVAIMGIGNHRIPNYELPSNIPGLTFSNPITKTQELSNLLVPTNDIVIALTHIGFAENPASVEVDVNVDANLVAQTTGLDAVIGGHSHTDPAVGFAPYKYLPSIIADANGNPVAVSQAYRYNNTLGEVYLGLRPLGSGNYEVVSQTGRYIKPALADAEDAAMDAIITPYTNMLAAYNNTVLGQTTTSIDALQAFTQETNAANLQADASVFELAKNGITDVDVHISGAMTNRKVADTATAESPVTLKVSDMFTLMPYENSLVVISMNGPQLKAVLERGYRNYYYYKYVPGYGGYSYYTTCMLDTNSMGRIYYKDTSPALPNGNNVMGLIINGKPVDFANATKYYNVSTVNYLAAGSCNFNDGGVSLWPLNQIVHDTQFYVRDAVIDYITYEGTVSPVIEGRLLFGDTTAPVITINAPAAQAYLHPAFLTLNFSAVDGPDGTTPSLAAPSGIKSITANLDTTPVTNNQVIDLYTLSLGGHTLTVIATDFYGNTTTQSVTFTVTATIQSLKDSITRFYNEGKIDDASVYQGLMDKLVAAEKSKKLDTTNNMLNAFINQVNAQSGKHITTDAANLLIIDVQWVIANLK